VNLLRRARAATRRIRFAAGHVRFVELPLKRDGTSCR